MVENASVSFSLRLGCQCAPGFDNLINAKTTVTAIRANSTIFSSLAPVFTTFLSSRVTAFRIECLKSRVKAAALVAVVLGRSDFQGPEAWRPWC